MFREFAEGVAATTYLHGSHLSNVSGGLGSGEAFRVGRVLEFVARLEQSFRHFRSVELSSIEYHFKTLKQLLVYSGGVQFTPLRDVKSSSGSLAPCWWTFPSSGIWSWSLHRHNIRLGEEVFNPVLPFVHCHVPHIVTFSTFPCKVSRLSTTSCRASELGAYTVLRRSPWV